MAPQVSSTGTPVSSGQCSWYTSIASIPQPGEGCVARRAHLLGTEPGALRRGPDLRGDDEVVAPPGERGADQSLRDPLAVDLGGVDPRDAGIEARVEGPDDLLVGRVRAPGVAARLPRAEADHRELGAVRAEPSHPHVVIQAQFRSFDAGRAQYAVGATAAHPRAEEHTDPHPDEHDRRGTRTRRRPVRRRLRRRDAAHGGPVHQRDRAASATTSPRCPISPPRSARRRAPSTACRRSRSSSRPPT